MIYCLEAEAWLIAGQSLIPSLVKEHGTETFKLEIKIPAPKLGAVWPCDSAVVPKPIVSDVVMLPWPALLSGLRIPTQCFKHSPRELVWAQGLCPAETWPESAHDFSHLRAGKWNCKVFKCCCLPRRPNKNMRLRFKPLGVFTTALPSF